MKDQFRFLENCPPTPPLSQNALLNMIHKTIKHIPRRKKLSHLCHLSSFELNFYLKNIHLAKILL